VSEGARSPRVEVLGDVVRRQAGPWTAGVHRLLAQLPDGIGPRPVALDDHFEVVTWVPGCVGTRPLSAAVRSDEALASAARLLRRFHDAVDGRVCHNDVGPWNVVFDGPVAVGLIDWDGAAAGSALSDVASAVWHFAPLYDDRECRRVGWPSPPDRRARVELFCREYGVAADAALWDAVAERQRWYLAQVRAARAAPGAPGAAPWLKVDPAVVEGDMAFLAGARRGGLL
jgi:Ser/Thr protein kinase RdoA (MazF antagonist)